MVLKNNIPKANQSVIQKAKYESQKFECKSKFLNLLKNYKNKKINNL